jgi:hypothetical protein
MSADAHADDDEYEYVILKKRIKRPLNLTPPKPGDDCYQTPEEVPDVICEKLLKYMLQARDYEFTQDVKSLRAHSGSMTIYLNDWAFHDFSYWHPKLRIRELDGLRIAFFDKEAEKFIQRVLSFEQDNDK